MSAKKADWLGEVPQVAPTAPDSRVDRVRERTGLASGTSRIQQRSVNSLEQLLATGQAFYTARWRYHAYGGEDEAEEERLCKICSDARLAFAEACERHFHPFPQNP